MSFFVLCFIKVEFSVEVKLYVLLLCACAILPAKAVPEMTYTLSGGTLNPTQSLTHQKISQSPQETTRQVAQPISRPATWAVQPQMLQKSWLLFMKRRLFINIIMHI